MCATRSGLQKLKTIQKTRPPHVCSAFRARGVATEELCYVASSTYVAIHAMSVVLQAAMLLITVVFLKNCPGQKIKKMAWAIFSHKSV